MFLLPNEYDIIIAYACFNNIKNTYHFDVMRVCLLSEIVFTDATDRQNDTTDTSY